MSSNPASKAPFMGLYILSDGRRIYMLSSGEPHRRMPAIILEDGRLDPGYVTADLLPVDSVYSELTERIVRDHPSTHGIAEALKLMTIVWGAVIDRKAPKDMEAESRIAKAMTKYPESLCSYIKESGVCGKEGSVKRPQDYLRNVYALCHYFVAACARTNKAKMTKEKAAREFFLLAPKGAIGIGQYVPQGMNWSSANRVINDFCRMGMPPSAGWVWEEFKGKSLKGLYEGRGLFVPKS